MDFSNIDILSQLSPNEIESQKVGLDIIFNQIREIAKEKLGENIIDDIFIEYSTVASMLKLGKMVGFAGIDSNNEQFCIDVPARAFLAIRFLNEKNLSIYSHKDFISKQAKKIIIGSPFVSSISFASDYVVEKVKVLKEYDIKEDAFYIDSNEADLCSTKYWSGTYDRKFTDLVKGINEFKYNNIQIDDLLSLYHIAYDVVSKTKEDSNKKSIYFGIPLVGPNTSHMPVLGQGAVFVYFTYKTQHCEDFDKLRGYINSLSMRLDYIVKSLIFNLFSDSAWDFWHNARRESIKSAIAAIMSRNMSHNLGSHYLYYTKTQLEKLAHSGGEFGPDIRGAARVLGYMQARMDYLSTVISNDRYPYAGVNFKSQIFDELTVDDFSKRHFEAENISVAYFNDIVKKIINKSKKLDTLLDEYNEDEMADISKYIDNAKILIKDVNRDIISIKGNECNRTTNFLLSNLILSEQYSRKGILDDKQQENLRLLRLRVVFIDQDGEKYEEFTGEHSSASNEGDIKLKLSRLYFGLPGGVMSRHAFFNVLENFIRNSAKYLQDNADRKDLIVTIAIKDKGDFYEFIIYDNKCNANQRVDNNVSLIEQLNNRLSNIRIIENNGTVEKSNKGFKEMIFSTIWMRSYKFATDNSLDSLSDVVVNIDSTMCGYLKLKKINHYAFTLVTVDDNGLSISLNNKSESASIGLSFELPKFQNCVKLNLSRNITEVKNASLNLFGDIVEVDGNKYDKLVKEGKNNINWLQLHQWFPRLVVFTDLPKDATIVDKFKYVLNKRFGNIENYQLSFGNSLNIEDKYKIYFKRHLSTGVQDMSGYKSFAYADSVSGGNFTITLQELYNDAIKNIGDIDSEYLLLKIKESALTRITFIDERLYKEMRSQCKESELACKNIRVLDLIINNEFDERVLSISADDNNVFQFTGNQFNDENDDTHFVSIHLGLIEKIVEKFNLSDELKDLIIQNGVEEVSSEEKLLNYKVDMFMRGLRLAFGNNVFISIHSGRGNFSKELEGPLKSYPFIAMAAIENAYNNSKYLLSQLFYNTVYIGKGELNSKN